MRAIRTALSSLLVLLTLTGPAAGQGTDEAEAIYEQAVAAFEAEEFADAARLFEQVFALDPHPVIMHSLARAYQELGDLPNALLYFRNIRTMNARENVQGSAETKIGEIEDELRTQGYDPDVVTSATYVPRGNLTITSQPEGAGVYINGDFQGTTPFIEPRVDEGTYSLRIELEGYHPIVEELEVQGGRTNLRSYSLEARTTLDDYVPPPPGYLTVRAPSPDLEVHVDGDLFGVTPIVGQGLPPGTYIVAISGEGWVGYTSTVEITTGEETEVVARMQRIEGQELVDPTRTRRNAGTALMITGGALVAGGSIVGVLALNAASEYNDDRSNPDRGDLRTQAQRNALVADILYGTGGALFVTGVVLRFMSPRRDWDLDPDLVVRPEIGPRQVGLRFEW